MLIKNSNDTIGNRTHDLPTCSAVPQPTALRRTPPLPRLNRNWKVSVKLSTILFNGNNTELDIVRGVMMKASMLACYVFVDILEERAVSTFRVWQSENLLDSEDGDSTLLDTT